MRKHHPVLRAAALLLLTVFTTASITFAADAGSSGDPLVTLSYLNETFLTSVMTKVDAKIKERNTALTAQITNQINEAKKGISSGGGGTITGTAATFELVSLEKGQTLKLGLGAEVLLRVGTASCVAASAPGLIDSTDGTDLAGGKALVKNHLYLATVTDRGVKAAAAVKVMVRGEYAIG